MERRVVFIKKSEYKMVAVAGRSAEGDHVQEAARASAEQYESLFEKHRAPDDHGAKERDDEGSFGRT